jgi:hypothetical protein
VTRRRPQHERHRSWLRARIREAVADASRRTPDERAADLIGRVFAHAGFDESEVRELIGEIYTCSSIKVGVA